MLASQLLRSLLDPYVIMHVLQLVTNEQAPFFQQQIRSLEDIGITSDVRSPVGSHSETESRSLAAYARLLSRTVREADDSYDLVHANYGLTAPAALAQRSIPTVLSLWGSDLLGSMGPLSRYCAKKVDEVIVMTPTMADSLAVPSHVIPHGVDMEVFQPIPQQKAQAKVNWDSNTQHVLFPYSPSRTIKDFPKAARVVAGVRKQVESPVQLQTLSDVPHGCMPYYYNAADVVLITSKREGSPNAVREALACNRPVVATDVGDIALHVEPVATSRVCNSFSELVDGVVSAVDEPNEVTPDKKGLSSNGGAGITGREQANYNSAQAMAQRIKTVYDRAVSGTDVQRHPPSVTFPQ